MPLTEAGYIPCDTRDDTFDMDGPADEGAGYPDLMHDDNDYYGDGCTCGRSARRYDDYADGNGNGKIDYDAFYAAYPGCPGCDPIMSDSKPYGFGIDSFEDPALQEANAYAAGKVLLACSMYQPLITDWSPNYVVLSAARREIRNQRWAANSRHDKALEKRSDRFWERLCDECKTHHEAVEKYTAWAKKQK